MPLLETGQTIRDTYEVERYLAEGAFAEVYRVKHRFLGRQAMKVFKRTGMTREELDETMSEAVLLSRLAHPNIVQVFDANTVMTDNGEYGYFTMENIPGGSLDKFWRSYGVKLIPLETSVDLLKQVCRGLIMAHSADPPIIHRDIKPQNILIGYEGDGLRARISDFGLAKQVNKLTLYATAAGTLAFKPPEVFTQAKRDSVAADIWALGVTLYMLLTDNIPFEVDEHLGWRNCDALRTPPPPPSQYNVEVNSALDRIVLECLSPDPDDRYADARKLLEALDAWNSGDDIYDKPTLQSASISEFSKDAFGDGLTPDQSEAELLAQKAIKAAKQRGDLNAAADTMEEAFNKWPSLREKHATRVTLWRRGISM
ncbi:serine/threonine protein kinase [Mariniblastus sp.]|nr:serine/threonine protein kinase [Mariniblastus sp.]